MGQKHKHHDVIVAWAADSKGGVEWSHMGGPWNACYGSPVWDEKNEYRIKTEPPAKVYPVTGMTGLLGVARNPAIWQSLSQSMTTVWHYGITPPTSLQSSQV